MGPESAKVAVASRYEEQRRFVSLLLKADQHAGIVSASPLACPVRDWISRHGRLFPSMAGSLNVSDLSYSLTTRQGLTTRTQIRTPALPACRFRQPTMGREVLRLIEISSRIRGERASSPLLCPRADSG